MAQVKKHRPRVGDRSWAVHWCAGIPTDENGDSDMDNADERTERFPTQESARSRAQKVVPLDVFGCVTVQECVFVPYDDDDAIDYPHVGFWDAVGAAEEFLAE